jgi:hypothetical protein
VKQVDYHLAEINYPKDKIKLVKCVAAHNEAGWIEYNLRNCYDEWDIIRVVEGAVDGRPGSTHDGHSTDNTVELIKNFPDPLNKIEFYQIDRPFKSLEEQKQIFVDAGQDGEFLAIVDCDEFYLDGDVLKLKEYIKLHPLASEFMVTFLHFYRDFKHIRDFGQEWILSHQRCVRWRRGARYFTHPVLSLEDGSCTYFNPAIQQLRFVTPLFIYHYGHAKGIDFHKSKKDFYDSELKKYPAGEGKTAADAFDEKFREFVGYSEKLDTVLVYDGPQPSVLANHPIAKELCEFYQKPEIAAQIRNWKQSDYYKLHPNLPTIPQWQLNWRWAPARMQPTYNPVEV